MKILKYIVVGLVGLLLLASILLVVTGNSHLFKGVANTYFKGRGGPTIHDLNVFDYSTIKGGDYQQWALAKDYNLHDIPPSQLKEIEAIQTTGFVIIKNDSLVHEQYWEQEQQVSNSFSMAKTYVSMLVGKAIQDGYIESVDEPITKYIPNFKTNEFNPTIAHVLSMSGGINFEDETYAGPFDFPAKAYYGNDLNDLLSNYEVTKSPGKIFDYNSGNTQVVEQILRGATHQSLTENLTPVWQKLGAEDAFWSLDHEDGIEKAYCCIYSNALDFARLGKLYMDHGKWNGEQLIDSAFVSRSTKPADLQEKDGRENARYGLGWWCLKYNAHDVFYARGILGQYIICIPDENLIIVRLGHKRDKPAGNDHPVDLYTYIEVALAFTK